ncbi:uncharacterized protein PADG_04260 [Paracoccidioides brasiliensis Pb18]|uniref:NIMA-interacting protein TinC n=1 Tax=Paracoccidioides brasiliensis (strain Pb18) TaxID=502780 RepID=C1GAH4_PARBD|nr:uncharacterized protein PADG_04260 [Paracoccidioides brasiliensis Pb18]EEH48176.2 hypothetical protein PADG_04260 [Paracoccidioides brasiliensis Pb18]
MAWSTTTTVAATCLLFLLLARPSHAFGAGNIASMSKIEGQNWRHGDIEDVILTLMMARSAGGKKFSKLDVQRIYFGNWLRLIPQKDYSQAIDIGTVKYVSAEAIRILLLVLGFMTFGYGTGEFEVTTERIGCYQPTEHIDNPLGYGEGEDPRRYHRRLRGPIDEQRELGIDPRTGLKNYIASEDLGIDNSAQLLRRLFGRCIELGRKYSRSRNESDLHEALRLMGTGLHTLEDYMAHSNYTELSLIELGETDIFPHVGRNTKVQLQGARDKVYPIVTGTFGGVDFLHSVMGEISDKATQSEIQSLEGLIADSEKEQLQEGFLQNLLDKVPNGLFGGDDSGTKMNEFKSNAQSNKKRTENISPREPEEWVNYLNDVHQQVYPLLEWHDNLMKSINKAIEAIPGLSDIVEQVQEQLNVFVFSVLAPYVLPIIKQVKFELQTGSSEVIQSSKAQQYNTFNDDYCTDPTHSMLSKDHFSNLLNEPAGKAAAEIVRWVVPQIMECWDDESIDVDRTMNRIISGVLHHPALRDYGEDGAKDMRLTMFGIVESWWNEQGGRGQDSLRRQLSREGVRNGDNHKPGVHDSGHGCGKPMTLPTRSHFVPGGAQDLFGLGGFSGKSSKQSMPSEIEKMAFEAVGGGLIGSLVGGIVGGATTGTLDQRDDGKRRKERRDYHSPQYPQQHDYSQGKDNKKDEDEKEKKKHKEEKGEKDDKKDRKDKKDNDDKREKKHKEEKEGKKYREKEEKKYKEYKEEKKEKKADKDKKHKEDKYKSKSYDDDGREAYQSSGYREAQYGETSSYGRGEESYGTGRSGGYGERSGGGGESRGYYGENKPRTYGDGNGGYSEPEPRDYGGFSGGESGGYGGGESRTYGHRQEYETLTSQPHGRREHSGSRERELRRYGSGHYGSDERRRGSRERDHGHRGDNDDDEDKYRRKYKNRSGDDDDNGSDDGHKKRHRQKQQHHRRDS